MKNWLQGLFAGATITAESPRRLGALAGSVVLLALLLEPMSAWPAVAATTGIATDSFNRTVSSGWGTADLGGSWLLIDNPANWSVAPGTGSITVAASAQERGVLGSVVVQDVDLLAEITLPRCGGNGANCDAYVLGRSAGGSTSTNYRVGAVQGQGSGTVLLRAQRGDGSYLTNDLNTGVTAADGVVVYVRVEFQGINPTTIRARVWQSGTVEPSTWLLNITDSTPGEQKAGSLGVRVRKRRRARPRPAAHRTART
jgi:large repetitive protein